MERVKWGSADLDLTAETGAFSVAWFNPRDGGPLQPADDVRAGAKVTLQAPAADDWVALIRKK